MANFHGHVLTRAGENLIAQMSANKTPLNYSSVKIGDGRLDGRLIWELSELISLNRTLPIDNLKKKADGQYNITAVIKHDDVT